MKNNNADLAAGGLGRSLERALHRADAFAHIERLLTMRACGRQGLVHRGQRTRPAEHDKCTISELEKRPKRHGLPEDYF